MHAGLFFWNIPLYYITLSLFKFKTFDAKKFGKSQKFKIPLNRLTFWSRHSQGVRVETSKKKGKTNPAFDVDEENNVDNVTNGNGNHNTDKLEDKGM